MLSTTEIYLPPPVSLCINALINKILLSDQLLKGFDPGSLFQV